MKEFSHYFGIDISKDVFDVVNEKGQHSQYANSPVGFKKFCTQLPLDSCLVMEATGVYHQQLADYLYAKKVFVSVVNPLVIKRYIQMNLRRIKTDKADAQMICSYAMQHALTPYEPSPVYARESRILVENIDLLIKSRTMLKNRIHALKHKSESLRTIIVNPLTATLKGLNTQIKKLEDELNRLLQTHAAAMYSRIQSIPGIGKSTAAFLIVISDGFTKFETAKQFTCYIGLSPVERKSGSSLNARSTISKQGNGKLRNLLFLCSFNACKYNKSCKALYERIVNKGKSKKLALIAVANKLLKQSFAIAKSGLWYDENHCSVLNGARG